ncbi:MAG: DUF3108 domain-containing protein [Desulfatitalea sp.]|nr:DUF3108 domain-containing protein [Desulfatitalea sp.]MBI5896380.1 DUF3108 domain-containing protein [Desulfobacterales bacterium]
MPFAPGEKLEYELRWGSIPAGIARLEVQPMENINGEPAYHFVLTAESNSFVDVFYKVRDRIDAFADIGMTRSVRYEKKQHEGSHKREELIEFDWEKRQASYSNFGEKRDPIRLMKGSFDPLSAFYYTRTAPLDPERGPLQRPITDGRKNVIGRLTVAARETITLSNGKTYQTLRVEPELKHVGGVFKATQNAKIQLWITDDAQRIPVRIQSKVKIGYFTGELITPEEILPRIGDSGSIPPGPP